MKTLYKYISLTLIYFVIAVTMIMVFSIVGNAIPTYYNVSVIGRLDPDLGSGSTGAMGINALGEVVGSTPSGSNPFNRYEQTAYLWQNGTITNLGIPPGSQFSE